MHKVMTADGHIIVPKYHSSQQGVSSNIGGEGTVNTRSRAGSTTSQVQAPVGGSSVVMSRSRAGTTTSQSHVPLQPVLEHDLYDSDDDSDIAQFDEHHQATGDDEDVAMLIEKQDMDTFETPLQVYRRKMTVNRMGREAAAAAAAMTASVKASTESDDKNTD